MTIAAYEARMFARLALPAHAGRAAFEAAQAARLVATVEEARALSPFYRQREDWPAAPIRGLADLHRLPFTTPADLARAVPPLAAVSGGSVARIVTLPTSGTSAPPKRLFFIVDELEATIDFFCHGMGIFTGPGDRVAIGFAGERPSSVGDGLARALTRLGAMPIAMPAAVDDPEADVAFLRREAPDIVAGPPVRLLAAARLARADGGAPITPRAVLLSADHAAVSLKRAIAAAWGCEVYEHWGMTETGYGGAVDCHAHAGLHLREADILVEIVDPATGAPLPAGAEGEIVITTLQPRATPLVRYRTGDRGRVLDGRCACGSHLRRLVGLAGRIDDEVALPGGARLSLPAIDEAVFAVDGVTDVGATLTGGVTDVGATVTDGAPAVLSLAIGAPAELRAPALVEAVRAAIVAVPAWATALAAGTLVLDVDLADGLRLPSGPKRRLVRENSSCESSGSSATAP